MSSRARRQALGVTSHLPVDDVRQSSFEAAHGFHRCLTGSQLAAVVAAAFGVVAQLNDGHDVQDAVDPAVAGPGQSVALVVAGGRIEWCGAVRRREAVLVREAIDLADVA